VRAQKLGYLVAQYMEPPENCYKKIKEKKK